MGDVVLRLPIEAGEEAQLFGRYLNGFMEARFKDAERMAASSDAPYLMIRSDLGGAAEIKVLIFQEPSVASAFSSGWAAARKGADPANEA